MSSLTCGDFEPPTGAVRFGEQEWATGAVRTDRGLPLSPRAVLQNRRWWHRRLPFSHVVAENVFVPRFYQELEAAFREVFDRGLSEVRGIDGFCRAPSGYDAYIYSIPSAIEGPLAFFVSRGWQDLLASVANVAATGDMSAALHHHEPHSQQGTIHNDLNPGWFVSRPRSDGINLADSRLCNYNNGTPHAAGEAPVERIRAIAMLFFLNNAAWRQGDGGECGLYAARDDSLEPDARIAPINNSLVLFECTPRSFHRFLGGGSATRDSVILWLHRDKAEAVARWGERAIVKWSR